MKPVLGLALLAGLILVSAGIFRGRVAPGRVPTPPGRPVPSEGIVAPVRLELVAPRVDVVGTVASEVKVNLSARLSACVREIAVTAGSPVTNGQELVLLDDRELREQATAAEAQFKQAEAEYARSRQLFDNKATTQQALTAAESLFIAARAQWERSRVMLTYARIVSPLDGVVTDRRVEPGDLAAPGRVLLAIYDPTRLQLEAAVPVRLLDKLPLGREVTLTLDRPAGERRGVVRQIVSEVDPLSRTQLVKVGILDLEPGILPGTFGRLWVEEEPRPALLAPVSAVIRVGQLEFVDVVQDGRAFRRAVRTGPTTGDRIEILSGLDDGEAVLIQPARRSSTP
jgi:RND family efflux transporter MFP subunit